MTSPRLALGLALALGGLASQLPLLADEIEILELSPSPPATLDGITLPPAGTPLLTTTDNSVTVLVRYRLDRGEATVDVFPGLSGPAAEGFELVPHTGRAPGCGTIRGPAAGRCAAAFAWVCPDGAPATFAIEQVAASLAATDGTILATDRTTPARYTFRCDGTSRRYSDCLVIGVAGAPGVTPLPIGRELPLCRCLRDDGARELRCGILHPDFFLVRRTPLPFRAGRSFSEVWEFLALTELDGPVALELTGAGLESPVLHSFGAAGRSRSGKVERFVVKGRTPANATVVPGRARLEYGTKGAESVLERAFEVDRTIEVSIGRSKAMTKP